MTFSKHIKSSSRDISLYNNVLAGESCQVILVIAIVIYTVNHMHLL